MNHSLRHSRVGIFIFTFFLASSLPLKALAGSPFDLERFLDGFHENPEEFMNRPPVKWSPSVHIENQSGRRTISIFGNSFDHEIYAAKRMTRNWVMERSDSSLMSPFDEDDRPENLIHSPSIIRNIVEIERRKLHSGSASESPWADSYWPMYKGMIAARYADGGFPHSRDWSANFAYIMGVPGAAVPFNVRSPAEKYDTLVGDGSFTLSKWNWNRGKTYQQKYGRVDSWMGICHGWAAAAHMFEPVSKKPFTVTAAGGGQITFYPSDVKALRSLLWAEAFTPTRFLGKRCETHRPKKDPAGRIIDEACFDTNSGTFFLALINHIGIDRKSFVIDSTFDHEVWNFPLQKYEFTFFNPQTKREVRHLDLAVVPMDKFTTDVFPSYRSPQTKFVVGVSLEVTHVNVYGPTRGIHGEPPTKSIQYVFDVELDSRMNVIGGEWYTTRHPDFIWTFNPGARAYAAGDHRIGANSKWDGKGPMPESWRKAAVESSGRGEPMTAIVDVLARIGSAQPESGENETDDPPPTP